MLTEGMPITAILIALGVLLAFVGFVWFLKSSALKATARGAGEKNSGRGQGDGVDRDPQHGVSPIEDPDPHGWKDS